MGINSKFLVKVQINANLTYDGNIVEDLMVGIDYATRQLNINQHLDEISNHLAFWGSMWAEAKYQFAVSDLQLRNCKSEYEIWLMQMKREASGKKELKSEKAKEEEALLNNLPEYGAKIKGITEKEMETFGKERDVNLVQKVLDAFKSKKDILISLATNLRSELEREILINEYNKRLTGKFMGEGK